MRIPPPVRQISVFQGSFGGDLFYVEILLRPSRITHLPLATLVHDLFPRILSRKFFRDLEVSDSWPGAGRLLPMGSNPS